MKLSENANRIYEKVNFYKRCENLSNTYRHDERLENYSNEEVLKIISDFGYSPKYFKKENFFKVEEKVSNRIFYFHVSFKYGLVEVIFGVMDENKKHLEGGTVSTICKLIEMSKGIDTEGYMKHPGFRDYSELRDILKLEFGIFNDFKNEVVEMNI